MAYDERLGHRSCKRDAKTGITAINVAISLVVTTTYGDGTVEKLTTNASHSFTRRFTTEMRNKYITPSPGGYPSGTVFEWVTQPNPECSIGWLGATGEATLFNETWNPTTDPGTVERGDEIESHAAYKKGECFLICEECCPCSIRLYSRGVTKKDATRIDLTLGELHTTNYTDYDINLPGLVTYNCKTTQPAWAGSTGEFPSANPVTITVNMAVAGSSGTDAEMTITPDQGGCLYISTDYSWTSPQGDIYIFTFTVGSRSYSSGGPGWVWQDFTYPDSSYPAVGLFIYSVNGLAYLAYEAATGLRFLDLYKDFQITAATKSDGNSGLARVGFIGKFAATAVNLFVPHTPYHDGAQYDFKKIIPTAPLPYDKIVGGTAPDEPNASIIHEQNVARCMADGGASWSRSFSTSETIGDTGTTRVGSITYSW